MPTSAFGRSLGPVQPARQGGSRGPSRSRTPRDPRARGSAPKAPPAPPVPAEAESGPAAPPAEHTPCVGGFAAYAAQYRSEGVPPPVAQFVFSAAGGAPPFEREATPHASAASAASAPPIQHETVRAGSVQKLCDEIARLQDALEAREEECVAALRKYDDLLHDRVAAYRPSGGGVFEELHKAHRELKDAQDLRVEHAELKGEVGEVNARLAATLAENESLRRAAAAAQGELCEAQRVHTRLIDALHLELTSLRDARAAAEEEARAARREARAAQGRACDAGTNTDPGGVITSEDMGALLEKVRGDLDAQLLALRGSLIAQHMETQVYMKRDTEQRLASLTEGVEAQMESITRASTLRGEYQHEAETLHGLEDEIARVRLNTQRKAEQLKQLKTQHVLLDHKLAVQQRSLSHRDPEPPAARPSEASAGARTRTPSPTISHHFVRRSAPAADRAPSASFAAGNSTAVAGIAAFPSTASSAPLGAPSSFPNTQSAPAGHVAERAALRLQGFQGEMQTLLRSLRHDAPPHEGDASHESLFV